MRFERWVWVLLAPVACSGGTDDGRAFGDNAGTLGQPGTGTGTGDDSGSTTGDPTASDETSTSTGEPTTTTGTTTGTTGMETGVDPTGATTSACMGAPTGMAVLGDTCMDGCECSSGICFSFPLLGSSCSECLTDAECQINGVGTCSINGTTESAACTAGELGVMCEPAATGCAAGLRCEQVIDTGGVIPDTFCSQCSTSADCPSGEVCTPNVILDGLQPGGFLQCIPAGSGADGTYCPASGDASGCASGFCAVVDIADLGIAEVGVCGPCAVDNDCLGPGETCQPAVVDGDGAVPSQCV